MNARYLAFDRVLIDLAGRRMWVAGVDVALEPKAFGVLVLLAQSPSKAFTRDEILDAVWGHRHVTPGVLNRAITLVRQSLGDSGKAIHTLHAIGYRFDGEVRCFSSRDAFLATKPVDGDAIAAGTTGDAAAPPEVEALASEPIRAAAVAPRARYWRLLFAVGLVGITVGLLAWYFKHHDMAKASIAVSPTLVVLPLHVIGDDKSEAAFADGLSEELTTRLARIEGLHLIASNTAERAQHEAFDATQLAERLHATHVIEGSLQEAGDQLRIDVRLIEVPSGKTIWAQGYDRKFADIFVVQQEVAQSVASALSLRIGLTHPSTRTPDPQVLREFLALRHTFLTEADDTDYQNAEVDLNRLAARAPDFAPVHGLLALNLSTDFEGEGKDRQAEQEAQRALALDPNDFYAHATLGSLAEKRHDWSTAKKEYDTALMLNPSEVIMHNIMGMWLARLGYGDLALTQFQIAYATDPLGFWVTYNLGSQLDVVGQHDQAKRYLDQLPRLEHASALLTAMARWRNAVWRRDLADAQAIAAQMPNETGLGTAYVAVTQAMIDPSRWPQADAAMAAYEAKAGGPTRLRLFDPQMHADAVLQRFETGTQRPDGDLVWAAGFKTLRSDPAFQDFLKHSKFIDYWNSNGWPPQCQPRGEGAHCE